jgi:two-component system, OmpR family, response regulator MprA
MGHAVLPNLCANWRIELQQPPPNSPANGTVIGTANVTANVMVVEDDAATQLALIRALTLDGHRSFGVSSGTEALASLESDTVDLVVLDVGLPDIDGNALCQRIRASVQADTASVPVLMLTARSRQIDLVIGLDSGADDYLTKPFQLDELHARVRALLRRANSARRTVTIGSLTIHLDRMDAEFAGHRIDLTHKEFELLALLMRQAGTTVRRDWLFHRVWGYPISDNSNSLDVYIGSLRKKLHQVGATNIVKTVRGVGFVFSGVE